MEVFFEVFYYNLITGTKIIVRYTEDFAFNRGSLYRGSTVKSLHSISTHFQLILVKLSSNFLFTNRDNRVKGSFLGSLSEVYSIMHRACLPTVGNEKNNRVGLSENNMPTSSGLMF